MHCYVYRSRKRDQTYLYLRERDDFSVLPDELQRLFAGADLAMELELTPERRLAREDPREVLSNLKARGFHLQMPPLNEVPF